jgi:hypothetical protein
MHNSNSGLIHCEYPCGESNREFTVDPRDPNIRSDLIRVLRGPNSFGCGDWIYYSPGSGFFSNSGGLETYHNAPTVYLLDRIPRGACDDSYYERWADQVFAEMRRG